MTPRTVDAPPRALGMRAVDEALRLAMARQAVLEGKVARARAKLAAKDDEIDQMQREVRARIEPRVAALRERDRTLHALFVELATDKRRRMRDRRQLKTLHAHLSDDTVLTAHGYDEAWARFAPARAPAHAPYDPAAEADDVASAARGDDSLRALYRRLAEALHPDREPEAAAKAARTEAMKQVTVAYREGDLARLLELERAWLAQVEVPTVDEQARRLARVEQSIAALEAELRELARARRSLRRSPEHELLRALGPAEGRAARISQMTVSMRIDLDRELEALERLHAHVLAYRDGTISLEEMLLKPPPPRGA